MTRPISGSVLGTLLLSVLPTGGAAAPQTGEPPWLVDEEGFRAALVHRWEPGLRVIDSNCDLPVTEPPPALGPYFSLSLGDGTSSEGGDLEFRTFELRGGDYIANHCRLDLVHYNEGKPENNHRDGFALQPVYCLPIVSALELEAGVGPYLTFNTTTEADGEQKNHKRLGFLATVAVKVSLEFLARGLHARVSFNYVDALDGHSSHALLLGLGYQVRKRPAQLGPEEARLNQVSLMGGLFRTNRGGTSVEYGAHLELKRYVRRRIAVSVGWLWEGDDALVDRQGLALQAWYVLPFSEGWAVSAGAGPYLANNERTDYGWEVNGLVSAQIGLRARYGWTGFLRLSRIITHDDTDRDVGELGIGFGW